MTCSGAGIELYWLPLGAGGWFVRLNGRIYEAVNALAERRRPLDLYHSALEVRVPEGRFVIENCWPIPDGHGAGRGVVVEGPVASRRLGRRRVFRYEVRRWRDGVIADADQAVNSPQILSDDPRLARRLLDLVGDLPSPIWGRDELGTGGDVELQLGDRLAAGKQRPPDGRDPSPGRWARAGMGSRPGRRRKAAQELGRVTSSIEVSW
jgi:hypothetical protein